MFKIICGNCGYEFKLDVTNITSVLNGNEDIDISFSNEGELFIACCKCLNILDSNYVDK